ncbi:hypothetical protein C2869_05265 [Saccharobesus litoralis]|uniref:Methane oxygenase PmoA n=1 Tax=Saccharobesus litoralis TaxID=2172099 RepID=A0A2S0VNU5_9ALTE|nr:DUF6807 family protein [Saccharobesus litoralis]AWB65886.1 hypothetical protein C2869_05265 [Saccharobesus litoralis]
MGLFVVRCYPFWGVILGGSLISQAAASEYTWLERDGVIALMQGKRTVWALNYGAQVAKPYFHPLSLQDGSVITRYEPHSPEHPWHKGLWFSFKYINGVNYWEENKQTGKSDGLTQVTSHHFFKHPDNSATLILHLQYRPHHDAADALIFEQRTLFISAQDASGRMNIDWLSHFTALADVTLDRTPLPSEHNGKVWGKAWGGYAGLSMRFAPKLKQNKADNWQFSAPIQSQLLTQAKLEGTQLHATQNQWMYYGGAKGGLAIFDHVRNSSQTASWYVAPNMSYFSPAFLFKRPLSYAAGQTWQLSYRVSIYSQPRTPEQLAMDDRQYRLLIAD